MQSVVRFGQNLNSSEFFFICKYKKDLIDNNREKVDVVFPIINLWELSDVMETRV